MALAGVESDRPRHLERAGRTALQSPDATHAKWHPKTVASGARAWLRVNAPMLLVVAHSLCVVGIVHFAVARDRANRVFDRIVASETTSSMSEEEVTLTLLHKLHSIMWTTKPMFAPRDDPDGNDSWRSPTDSWVTDVVDLLATGEGGCGSFSLVVGKALDRAGIDFRILQMTCQQNTPGCHILLEAKIDGRWAVLDPLFDLSFRKPDGKLASFAEVSRDWDQFRQQVPESRRTAPPTSERYYDTAMYDYSDVRGTNWNKVPVLMPAVRRLLVWVIGEERTKYISLRSWVYDINEVYLVASSIAYLLVLLLHWRRWRKRRTQRRATSREVAQPHPS